VIGASEVVSESWRFGRHSVSRVEELESLGRRIAGPRTESVGDRVEQLVRRPELDASAGDDVV
jgi:hypothetical protein